MSRANKGQRQPNIRDFFRPQTPRDRDRSSPLPPLPTPKPAESPVFGSQSSLPILSSPHKPLENAPGRPAYSRDAVIAGSDEDESSDEDLATLDEIFAPNARPISPPPLQHRLTDPCITPDAKRRLSPIYRSPVSMQSRIRFDMGALLKHAKKDDATDEGFRRVTHLEEAEEVAKSVHAIGRTTTSSTALRGSLVKAVGDQEEHRLDKVVQAVSRTEVTTQRKTWHFFESDEYPSPDQDATPFPKKDVQKLPTLKGVARFEDIDRNLLSMIASLKGLPDSLLLYILEGVCSPTQDEEFENVGPLLALCPEQVARLITPQLLESLFQRLGATPDLTNHTSALKVANTGSGRYKDHSWSRLSALLNVLWDVSLLLSVEANTYLTTILLRLAVDLEVLHDPNLLADFQFLFHSLVNSIPDSHWESHCYNLCTAFCTSFVDPSLRLHPLHRIPTTTPRLHDLRRRLSIVSTFNDTSLARTTPDTIITLPKITEFLQQPDFKITPETDYVELRARMALLNIAIDTASPPPISDDVISTKMGPDEMAFNKEVDTLVHELKKLSRGINDTGMRSMFPTETKGEIEWIMGRLACTVRTRPEPKESIFDVAARQKDDEALPRQREYLERFLKPSFKRSSG